MGSIVPKSTSFQLPDGREVILETGKLGTQAHGSVVVKIGQTMLFCSVVSNYEAREGQSFFPLSVDYQEKFAAAGRIPGNFFRREARLSDYEILTSRLVDRALRPLFPDGYMNETQVIINLISSDKEELPDSYAALAASTALSVSNIPWSGPISEVRVAKINENYVVNPKVDDVQEATLDIIVGATLENVTMVEGEAKECQEAELVEAIQIGHEAIKVQCQAQLELANLVGEKATVKRELEEVEEDAELKSYVENFAQDKILQIAKGALTKFDRKEQFKTIKESLIESLTEEHGEEYIEENLGQAEEYFEKLKKETIRSMMLELSTRLDGRAFDEIRDIWTEIDYLPSTHGSAIFTRGETQALTSLTLGTKQDQLLVDNALASYRDDFILHYNFPAYSVGEVKPMRGPGRREVGHANLAGRSIRQILPSENPYTLRLVSDILESNGSSSMATVCAGSLALMDGGIKIKSPIAGIAMGLITDGEQFAILSDILGDEDALGDMDFKVTGTKHGICGCQMDIKIDGLPSEIMIQALEQARKGRLHILEEMNKSIAEPREDLKPHAPRIAEIIIEKSFIGAVIGPGGSVIQELQEMTNTVISIEEVDDKGIVSIASNDKASIDAAVARIKEITFTPTVGDIYDAKVASVMPYGVFVDFKGKSGLVHVSEISHTHIKNVEDALSVGDEIKVKLIGVDRKTGKMKLSRKATIPRPEGNSENRDDNRHHDRHRGRGNDRNRNRRNDRDR